MRLPHVCQALAAIVQNGTFSISNRPELRDHCCGGQTTRIVSPNEKHIPFPLMKCLVQQRLVVWDPLWVKTQEVGCWQNVSSWALGSAHAAPKYHFWLLRKTISYIIKSFPHESVNGMSNSIRMFSNRNAQIFFMQIFLKLLEGIISFRAEIKLWLQEVSNDRVRALCPGSMLLQCLTVHF